MTSNKIKYLSKIYDLDYDLMVTNPEKEIRGLLSWLGWEWDDSYLSPHLNKRLVSTASSVQVRQPINTKSVGGWKNYRNILKPAIDIILSNQKYRNCCS